MFNDKYGLTKAVLEGRKTMTRRSVPEKLIKAIEGGVPGFAVMESKFKVGEVAAVAQAYDDIVSTELYADELLVDKLHLEDTPGWSNKMFVRADLMPHQIRIKNVRVERLQDISDEDCIREGIVKALGLYGCEGLCERGDQLYFGSPRSAFAALINKISGKGTWESNPWVFVYEFELVK